MRWELGMWDPLETNRVSQWWESPAEQSTFINAIREVLGLKPMPGIMCAAPKSREAPK